jgi:hypothetical protein
MKLHIILLVTITVVGPLNADLLILDNGQKLNGEMIKIADDYIEYKAESSPGDVEWLKVMKKDILAVLNRSGKLSYPRDKFDENSLNFGKIRLRNEKERQTFEQRKSQNQNIQTTLELREKDKYKVAAIVGSLSGIMLWALIDNK